LWWAGVMGWGEEVCCIVCGVWEKWVTAHMSAT